ncbi:SDR family oxidoreductase [Primorskyibacter sp. S187A]|uniref:SDR family oxidoreductase n=1 Tax=Primorskyibacter sp. S187A TaxID=3415130 RepID=UPI003C79AE58
MKRVFIAGATGYLGRHLCAEYQRRGWYVIALVRHMPQANPIAADQLVEAQATEPATLDGIMTGVDLVVSCLGITRQADGLGYWEVDYQANLNLLREAERADVSRFAYIHVMQAHALAHVPLVAAKSAFVEDLQRSPIASTIIAPTGYFSDMGDFLDMAQSGRVFLFGDGRQRINPIHGADLATATAEAVSQGADWRDVGGPEVFTHRALAELAFACVGRPPRIVFLPDTVRRIALWLLPYMAPRRISGPARFFLSALAFDMVGTAHGTHSLKDHFEHRLATAGPARADHSPMARSGS